MRVLQYLLLGLAGPFVVACGGDATGVDEAAPVTAAAPFERGGDATQGADAYARHCASCHGIEGRGDGPAGLALRPQPTNFVTAELEAERAYRVTKDGGMAAGLSAIMPPFGRSMSDEQLRDVVAYVLSLHGETQ